jgi:soluble lytic murein transglycosylase
MLSGTRMWSTVGLGVFLWTSCINGEAALEARIRRASGFYAAHYAGVYQIPVELVEAVIEVESDWKPEAVSDKGAFGLMQLMPATAERFSVVNPFNIEQNIRAGVEYLARLKRLFKGDLRLVLAAYAAGERRVLRRGLAYSCPEVVSYVHKVARLYSKKREERFSQRGEDDGSVVRNTSCPTHAGTSDSNGEL